MSAPAGAKLAKDRHAYNVIREKIMSGHFGANSRLTAADLAVEAGTSVGPTREAMRRLEAEGLISYRSNVGATVIALDRRELLDSLHTLAALEGLATALAAPLLTADDLDHLDQTNDEMDAALQAGAIAEVSRLNRVFHRACYAGCPNAWLLELLQKTTDRAHVGRRSFFHSVPNRPQISVVEHRELVQLLRNSAPATAIEAAVRHHKVRTIALATAESD